MSEKSDMIFLDIESLREAADKASKDKGEREMVSFWILRDYKESFDDLQIKTGKEFGKQIQIMIMQAIDVAKEQI